MPPLATTDDVAAIWQPLTPDQERVAAALINQASAQLRLRARRRRVDLDAKIADDLYAAAVTAAIANAVKRVLMNPRALRQWSEGEGPLTESATLDTAISAGALYFAPADLADIFPPRRLAHSFRVRTGLG